MWNMGDHSAKWRKYFLKQGFLRILKSLSFLLTDNQQKSLLLGKTICKSSCKSSDYCYHVSFCEYDSILSTRDLSLFEVDI